MVEASSSQSHRHPCRLPADRLDARPESATEGDRRLQTMDAGKMMGNRDGVMKLYTPLTTIAFGAALLCASPAGAQFGNPFEPPRPPGSVPVRPQPSVQPPLQPQAPPQPANPQLAPPPGRAGIQSEDLPPPGSAQPAALPRPGSAPPAQT